MLKRQNGKWKKFEYIYRLKKATIFLQLEITLTIPLTKKGLPTVGNQFFHQIKCYG